MSEVLFSPEQYLELEAACDQFEGALKDPALQPNQAKADTTIKSIVGQASSEIQSELHRALTNLLSEHQAVSSADTHLNRQSTLTPHDFVTRLDRVSDFGSSGGRAEPDDFLESPDDLSETGQLEFGRLRLHSVVGRGGSGIVWRAYDINLGRWVALKISHPNAVSDSKRFVREAQSVAQLKHPNIIPVFDGGELNGRCFLISEFCSGKPLSQMINGQPMPPRVAVEILLGVLAAVGHSHDAGIIHRDIKPQNVMMTEDGVPLVTDFGLAKNLVHDQTLTLDGELIGTPAYMAPEQAQGDARRCDERTDIYSIGVVLFQLLSGQVPFSGSFERVVFQVINAPVPDVQSLNPEAPRELAAICAKCLEKSPDRRFQSTNELAQELNRFLEGHPVETRKVSLTGRYLRWLQREPAIAWTTSICAALLTIAAIGSSFAAYSANKAWRSERVQVVETKRSLAESIQARKQETEARKQETKARTRAERAEAVAKQNAEQLRQLAIANRKEADFIANVFAPDDLMGVTRVPVSGGESSILPEATIKHATRQADQLLDDAPIVKARIKGMLGNAWRSRGRFDNAQSLLTEATELLKQHGDTNDPLLVNDRAMNHLYRAFLFHHQETFKDAEHHYRESIKLHRRSVEANESSAICKLQLAQAEFGLGALFLRQSQNEKAKPWIEKAILVRREHLNPDDSLLLATELAFYQCNPDRDFAELQTVLKNADSDATQKTITLYWEQVTYRSQKKYDQAISRYKEIVQLLKNNIGTNNSIYWMAIGDFAELQRRAGNYVDAFEMTTAAIREGRLLSQWHPKRMKAMMLMAFELGLADRYPEAKTVFLEVTESESAKWNDRDELHSGLAWCHFHDGEFDKALRRSVVPLRKIGHCTAAETVWAAHTHAIMLAAAQRDEEAIAFEEQALSTAEKMVRNSTLPEHSTWLRRTAATLTHHERLQSAEVVWRRAIVWAEKEYFVEHPRVAGLKMELGDNLIRQRQPDEALPFLNQAISIQLKCLPEGDKRIANTRQLISRATAALNEKSSN